MTGSPTTERGKQAARERAKRWYEANKERGKANAAAWKKANRDKVLNYRRTEHSKERLMEGAVFDPEVDYDSLWTGICGVCAGPMYRDVPRGLSHAPTVDHIIPISQGGSHVTGNIQWTHMGCNASKGARL